MALLERSSAGHEVEDEDDDGENQEDVDPAAEGVTADQTHDPENEENDSDGPKHDGLLIESRDRDWSVARGIDRCLRVSEGRAVFPVVRCR